MGKVSKSTKKFQSNHLKRTIDERKKQKEYRKRIQGRRGNKSIEEKQNLVGTKDDQLLRRAAKEEVFRDLSVEKFFEEGFSVPKTKSQIGKEEDEDVESDGSDSELQDYLNDQNGDAQEEKEETTEIDVKSVKKWNKMLAKTSTAIEAAAQITNMFHAVSKKYVQGNNSLHEQIIHLALTKVPSAIHNISAYKLKKDARTVVSSSTTERITQVCEAYGSALANLLKRSEQIEQENILNAIHQLLPYLVLHKHSMKKILKILVAQWLESQQNTLYEFLRTSAKEMKGFVLETILKASYNEFVLHNKKAQATVDSKKLALAKLFCIDHNVGYQLGFEYIRQLAVLLKNVMSSTSRQKQDIKDTNAYKVIYNQQMLHTLDLWSVVISISADEETSNNKVLMQLVSPLVQVILGVIRLIPTPQFYPMRFKLLQSLIRIIKHTNIYVPIYPFLLEVVTSSLYYSKRHSSKPTDNKYDMDIQLVCKPEQVDTVEYKRAVSEKLLHTLAAYLALYCKNIAFPEFAMPIQLSLEQVTNGEIKLGSDFKTKLSNMLEKCKHNSDFIEQKRSNIEFAPTQQSQASRFLNDIGPEQTPLGAYLTSHYRI